MSRHVSNWFSDQIEISSPGGPYGLVNPGNFGKGATDYRNPLVAEAMKVLGYVQRFGLGIPLAENQLEKRGRGISGGSGPTSQSDQYVSR